MVTSTTTHSDPRLGVPVELAPLVTRDTFILLNKTDLLPSSALAPAVLAGVTQHGWAVSLASHAGTEEFLGGLAKALQERYGKPFSNPNRMIQLNLIHHAHAGTIFKMLQVRRELLL